MRYWDIESDDCEEMVERFRSPWWESRHLQLSPGPLGFRTRAVDLSGVYLELNHFGQALHAREWLSGSRLAFLMAVDAPAPPRVFGRDVDAGQSAIDHPELHEVDAVTAAGTTTLVVLVYGRLLEDLTWSRPAQALCISPGGTLAELVAYCRAVLDAAARDRRAERENRWRRGVLSRLRAAYPEWTAAPGGRAADAERHRLVRDAVAALEAGHVEPAFSVAELADGLGSSRRTLFRAFHHVLGMGPYEYDQIRRLHRFREHLLTQPRRRGHVAEAAASAGFFHHGRLAALYRDHFGEVPTQTVRRRAAAATG